MTMRSIASQGLFEPRWKPVRRVLEAMEQAMAQGWYPARRRLLSHLAEIPSPELPSWVPEADLEESPREFIVSLALPGVEKSDIRVEAEPDCLIVSGQRSPAQAPAESCRRELPSGKFLRRVRLPAEIKPQAATAAYHNGVLRVCLPRLKASAGHSIKVD